MMAEPSCVEHMMAMELFALQNQIFSTATKNGKRRFLSMKLSIALLRISPNFPPSKSAAASLAFKDQLLADIPEDTIKGFASMSAALGYIVAQHKQIKRAAAPQISYSTLFRIFCGASDPSTLSLPSDDATIAILTRKLADMPDWMWLSELSGLGSAERNVVLAQHASEQSDAQYRRRIASDHAAHRISRHGAGERRAVHADRPKGHSRQELGEAPRQRRAGLP